MVLGRLSEGLRKLLDSWRIMRIMTLAYNVLSKRFPALSWEFDFAVRLYQAFVRSKYKEVFTPLASDEGKKTFDHLFELSISTNMSYDEFLRVLMAVDEGSGVLVTAYWLTCIFGYQEKSEFVWAHFPIFYSIAREICESKNASYVTKRYIKEKWVEDPFTGLRFTHRYHKDAGRLLTRTIEILCEHGGTLNLYIDNMLKRCDMINEENWIRLMAAALNMLTYDEKACVDEDLYEYAEREHFILPKETELALNFKKVKVGGCKRLWVAIRDYIIYPYLNRLVSASCRSVSQYLNEIYRDLLGGERYFEQLELPGDVWNEDFHKKMHRAFSSQEYSKDANKGCKSCRAAIVHLVSKELS